MSELRHWTTEDASEAEVRLLRAARGAKPSPAARARIGAAIGLDMGGPADGAPRAKASATAAGALAQKGLLLVFASAVAGGGAWLASTGGRSAPGLSTWEAKVERARPAEAPTQAPALVETAGASSVPSPAPAAPGPLAAQAADRERSARTPAAPSTSGSSSPSSWEAELRLLEAANASLDRHQPSAALVQVSRYERLYPRGKLTVEAEVIRVEALVGLGRRDEARRVANAFLRSFPNALQVPRVRTLLRQADEGE
jgi:hypothetical protein